MRIDTLAGLVSSIAMLSVFGCGGGTVSIAPQEEGVRPPQVVIQDLKKARTSSERDGQLRALLERRGDHLAWYLFWQQLRDDRFTSTLIAENYSSFFELSSRSCERDDFASFARFVIYRRTGWEYLLGPKRSCDTPLEPSVASQAVRVFLSEHSISAFTRAELEQVISFLTKEMRSSGHAWSDAITPGLTHSIDTAVRRLIELGDARPAVELAVQFRSSVGAFPFKRLLRDKWLTDRDFGPQWVRTYGAEDFTRLLLDMLTPSDFDSSENTSAQFYSSIIDALLDNPFDAYSDGSLAAWLQYKRIRSVIELISSTHWPLEQRLSVLYRLHNAFESWFKALADSEALWFAEQASGSQTQGTATSDLHWFLYRRFSPSFELREKALATYRLPYGDSSAPSAIDRVVAGRMRVIAQTDTAHKNLAVDNLCEILAQEGIAAQDIFESDLTKRLEQGIAPGCFRIISPHYGFEIRSELPLSTSADTVLRIAQPTVRLSAPSIHLGIIDMSAPIDLPVRDLLNISPVAWLNKRTDGGSLFVEAAGADVVGFISSGNKSAELGRIGIDGVLVDVAAEDRK